LGWGGLFDCVGGVPGENSETGGAFCIDPGRGEGGDGGGVLLVNY